MLGSNLAFVFSDRLYRFSLPLKIKYHDILVFFFLMLGAINRG